MHDPVHRQQTIIMPSARSGSVTYALFIKRFSTCSQLYNVRTNDIIRPSRLSIAGVFRVKLAQISTNFLFKQLIADDVETTRHGAHFIRFLAVRIATDSIFE